MMKNIVKKTPRLDINIDVVNRNILIIQKWKYNWISNGFSDWSYSEKKKMHEAFEKEIDAIWNRRVRLKCTGSSPFARNHKNDVFTLCFDIQWNLGNSHWIVDVSKVASNNFKNRPSVDWGNRKIQLYTVDTKKMYKVGAPKGVFQKNISHEFGHAIGNSRQIVNMHADEYSTGGKFYNDKTSIMNVGMELRKRHFDYILRELNTIMSNTDFRVSI